MISRVCQVPREVREHADIWRLSVPGRENSKCKGPKEKACLE